MFILSFFSRVIFLSCSLITIAVSMPSYATMDPRFELDPLTLGISKPPVKKALKTVVRPVKARVFKQQTGTAQATSTEYVVKPGDNLFKILMRDYGLNDDEAASCIELIRKENNINDIKHLKVGQKITIPLLHHGSGGISKSQNSLQAVTPTKAGVTRQAFRLESPAVSSPELGSNSQIKQVWDSMLPPSASGQESVVIQSPTYSLSLDPQRYPVYTTMDNHKILVDRDGSIPPLIKQMLAEKEPTVRIVSESPRNATRFLSAMLAAAGFYSVEEDFSIDYGSDPRLTVRSDFKIEKTADSVIKQDIILMNAGYSPYPNALKDFLKKDGLTVYEPFAKPIPETIGTTGQLFQITSTKLPDIMDGLLSAFSIAPEKNKNLDVFADENNGISLSVKADRYFERNGKRHIITCFDGDSVTYTLYRLLETKGYEVVILDSKDDFRKTTEKLLSRFHIQSGYARHQLGAEQGMNYSLQMSGFMLEGAGLQGKNVFLTNLEMDSVFSDLLKANGYSIIAK